LRNHRNVTHIHRETILVPGEQGEIIGTLLVFYDQTEQHNLERAREEFSQMIIHDLRSPLTAVTSNVDLLSEMVPPDHEFGSLVEQTTGSSQRAIRKLLNRVDSLLEVARMQSGQMVLEMKIARLSQLVENVRVELEPLARRLDVRIVPGIPDDEPLLEIDAEKIERVLLNLVDNALKFSPPQSEIVVRAYRWHSPAAGHLLRVDVVDYGPGIPADEQHNIFDRFVQVQQQPSPYRRGSGLGLSFCKMAIEAHAGTIWFEDNPDGGSVFSFTLPLTSDEGEPIT
jgi:signal transduction histidine kinase